MSNGYLTSLWMSLTTNNVDTKVWSLSHNATGHLPAAVWQQATKLVWCKEGAKEAPAKPPGQPSVGHICFRLREGPPLSPSLSFAARLMSANSLAHLASLPPSLRSSFLCALSQPRLCKKCCNVQPLACSWSYADKATSLTCTISTTAHLD